MHVVVLVLLGLSASASEASSHSLFSSTDLGHAADKRLITPLFGSIVSWLPVQGNEEGGGGSPTAEPPASPPAAED